MFRLQLLSLLFFVLSLLSCGKDHHDSLLKTFGPINNYNDSIFPKDITNIPATFLHIQGNLPDWLEGNLLQNGPAKFNVGNQQIVHWFDGFAYISSIKFLNQKILYQASFLETDQYLASSSNQQIKLEGFAQNFGATKINKTSTDGQKIKTANANINIQVLDNKVVAVGETPLPIEIDPRTTQTIGIFDFTDQLKKADSWESAHMKLDPIDDAIYNFYIDYGWQSYYAIYKIEPGTTRRMLLAKQKIDYPSYMHDFSITKNYIILTAYPLTVNAMDLIDPKDGFINAHQWQAEKNTQIYVFDKYKGKLVCVLPTEAMFAFHHINAFEDEQNNINLYLNSFVDPKIIMRVGSASYKNEPQANLKKLVINLQDKSVKTITIAKEFYELPTINPYFVGKKNQFFYAVRYDPYILNQGFGIIKYDLYNNQIKAWQQEDMFAGEPLFIAKPNSQKEDEGVIISTIYDAKQKKSFIIILNSISMQELARAYLPQASPLGLHGKFITNKH